MVNILVDIPRDIAKWFYPDSADTQLRAVDFLLCSNYKLEVSIIAGEVQRSLRGY
jgi:hypothetical protein